MPDPQADVIRRVLGYTRRIAVVGVSARPYRDSHSVSAQMQAWGYHVAPVNPTLDEVLGVRAYPSVSDVPGPIDLVNVFRRDEHIPEIAQEAVEVGAKALWLQLDLVSPRARAIATDAGLDVVYDRCLMVEVRRLMREMTLPPAA